MPTNNAINLIEAGVVTYDGAGVFSASTTTQYSLLLGDANNDIANLGVATDGQLPIGSTGANPVLATLTPGVGVSITNAAGSITIDATGGGLSWVDVTSSTQAMAVNSGYVVDNGASLVTFTLPASASFGSVIRVVGMSSGGWLIAQNDPSQQIFLGDVFTTAGSAGSLSSTNEGDCVELICVVADTLFAVASVVGNITYV